MEIVLISYGEIALKKGNRTYFERVLINNIKNKIPDTKIKKEFGRIYIEKEKFNENDIEILKSLPGIHSFSKVLKTENDFDKIFNTWCKYIENQKEFIKNKTYKFITKRADKSFPIHSDQFSLKIGKKIQEKFKNLNIKFEKKSPEITFYTEIRKSGTYIYINKFSGIGGLPVGTAGKALALISGGIDSPVASFLMIKRGMAVDFIHFFSPPYTSEKARKKVIDLVKILRKFQNKTNLYIVPFTKIQISIRKNSELKLLTILMRRAMFKISEKILVKNKYKALITGESLAQVASQTIQSMKAVSNSINSLILRPLVGLDKEEIVKIAKRIGTYDTSILPYEDCCTIFVPSHPATNPDINKVIEEEKKWFSEELIEESLKNLEKLII